MATTGIAQRSYQLAGGLGAIPFIAALWAVYVGGSWAGLTGQVALHSYGVAITAFMAGTLWGGTFSAPRFNDALLGMAAAIAVAFTVWMPMAQAYLTLAILLGILWCYDLFRYYRYGLPSWYISLRCCLSSVAIACLLAGLFIVRLA